MINKDNFEQVAEKLNLKNFRNQRALNKQICCRLLNK